LTDATKDGTTKKLTPKIKPLDPTDPRVANGLFTLRESAHYLGLPYSTLHTWARPANGQEPLVTSFAPHRREARVPFIGFAEAYVLSAFRKAHVPMQRIRPAVEALAAEIGIEHALASERLYTDGAEVLYDFAANRDDEDLLELTVVRTGQTQFSELVKDYLKRITYGNDGWASQLRLPTYQRAEVVVNPRRGFGLPLVVHGGARVEDLVDRFVAGDSLSDIADDFGVPEPEVEDVIRVAASAAA
jgi:uncharacterized protein (DUF433 family)